LTRDGRLRVPSYSCLDLRLNKAFHFDRLKLTVYGEVLNVMNRTNYRFNGINSIRSTGEVRLARGSILPILPIAGLAVEFYLVRLPHSMQDTTRPSSRPSEARAGIQSAVD
jgi:hypothetical protein